MPQPRAYMIAQTGHTGHSQSRRNHQLSEQNTRASLAQAQRFGWKIEIWPAVDGFTLDQSSWDRIGVRLLDRGAIVKRPGARGCFHSHFGLWCHAAELNEPIIILEHDAHIVSAWDTTLDLDRCVWKLHTPDGRGDQINEITGLWSRGAWAYTVTASQARALVEFSQTQGAQAVDKQIGSNVVEWSYTSRDLAVHRPAIYRSTTSPKLEI